MSTREHGRTGDTGTEDMGAREHGRTGDTGTEDMGARADAATHPVVFGRELPAPLKSLPRGSVLSIAGAGGKTTLLHRVAEAYREKGFRVLATTTTHMRMEPGMALSGREALAQLAGCGYSFAGLPDPKNSQKCVSLPEEELRYAAAGADLTVIEADGARHMPFKVPYGHEPVIPPFTTCAAVLCGLHAAGKSIQDAAYNAGGVVELLAPVFPEVAAHREGAILTEDMLFYALRAAYQDKILRAAPRAGIVWLAHRFPYGDAPRPAKLHLIYLAAGFSRRFGSNKLFHKLDGRPMYRHLLDRLAGIAEAGEGQYSLTVVTQYSELERELRGKPLRVVFNEDPSRGISSSLIRGIEAVEESPGIGPDDMLVFFTADQPFFRKGTAEAFFSGLRSRRPPLAAVGINGEPVSPCAFRADYIPELKALTGDRGGKRILLRHPGKVWVFDTDLAEELEDIDTL